MKPICWLRIINCFAVHNFDQLVIVDSKRFKLGSFVLAARFFDGLLSLIESKLQL